ncbi:MAG: dTDP-4-dehydrorhamnose 3,5-epimerase [Thermodesulfovibrio sp.]|nr:dTDP-4-dehydrorhamnose 3,5-epimerase [Thermodesulfovibrio sp.]MDW7998981.1 dTDP-4-dehydrorhamnose 3,5-epimerase [Thermodesulfovibrio sp.]
MGKLKKIETSLLDVYLLEPTVFEDHRGFFMESYNKRDFEELGLFFNFVQDNHSLSVYAGVLRGLHFQLEPKAQTKIVRCLKGVIYDVVVDLRKGSPTYKKWAGFILSEYNKRQILVPKGFAHGILTLTPNTEILYKVDEYYSPEHDRSIRWDDPEIGIDWPLKNPILSEKDRNAPFLKDIESEINFYYREDRK